MSFGFSPSDVFALMQLAKTTYDNCRRAPEHFGEAGRGAKSLHLVFQNLQSEIQNPTSLLNRNEDAKSHIAEIANNCKIVLSQLDGIVRKHSSLGTSKVKALDRFRFPRKEVLDIQGKLGLHESHLMTYLETIGVSALGRVEQKFETAGKSHEEIMDGLAKVLGAVDKLGAEIRVGMHPESQFSDHTDDEKPVWRALRRKLINVGITSKLIQRYEEKIVERVKEMNDYGLLDSEAPTETSDDAGFDTETPLPPSVKIKAIYQPPEAMTDTESGWDSEATLPLRPSKIEVRRKAPCGTIMNQRRRRAASNGNTASNFNLVIPSIVLEEQTSGLVSRNPEEKLSGKTTPRSASPASPTPGVAADDISQKPTGNKTYERDIPGKDESKPLDEGISMENFEEPQYNNLPTQDIAELEAIEAVVQPNHSNPKDFNVPKVTSTLPQSLARDSRRKSPGSIGWSTPRNATPPPRYSRTPEPRGRSPPHIIIVKPRKPVGPIPGAETRIWTGVDSRLKLKAKFVNFDGNYVRLVESDGGETIVFASKLSQPDLDYIDSLSTKEPPKVLAEKVPEIVKTVRFDDSKKDEPKSQKLILNTTEADVETVRHERPDILNRERSNFRPVWRYRKSRTLPRQQIGFETNELPLAASKGDLEKVKKLLQEGAFVDWDGEERTEESEAGTRTYTVNTTTGLYRAAKRGHLDVAQLLLEYGANVDTDGILKAVAGRGNTEMVRLLLEYGADTEQLRSPSDYSTALHAAAEDGYTDIVEALLDFGADIEARDKDNETPLYHAAMGNHGKIVKMLLREGADTTPVAEDGQTALYKAAGRGYERVVRSLLSYGADPNLGRGLSGETALYKATRKGWTEVVYLLMQYGADPNLPNDTKDWAAGSTMDTIIWLLRPEESPKNAYGQCPLYAAAEKGHGEIVGMLLNHGAAVNAKTKKGETAIYAAAGKAHKDVVAMLLKRGATLAPQEEVDIVTKLMDPNNRESEEVRKVQTPKRMEIISMLLSRMSTKRILRGLETWRNGESIPGLDMIADTIRKIGA